MVRRGGVPSPVFVLLMAAAVTLPGCATRQQVDVVVPWPEPEETVVETPAEPDPAVEALYAGLDEHRLDYEAGLDLIVAGQEVAGEERIAAAARALNAGAQECDRTSGCDMERFLATFDALLTEQGIALKKQTARIVELETSIEEDVDREPGTSPFMAAMPEMGKTVSMLRGTDLREIITLNGPVSAALDDWLTWLRPMLMDAYENYQFLRDEIAPIYEEAGLPEALLFAMIATETGGKVHAHSRAGAAGPLQFMRRTGRLYGLTVVDGFDMRLDPAAATRASVAYLNDQFEQLNSNLEKALAAYNGGESRMQRLHRKYGGSSLWDSRVYYSLPRETREYVPRVLAAAWLFLHPEDYNLEWPTHVTDKTTLALRQEISLGELTICLGQEHNPDGWFRTLRNLNPRLNPGDLIEAGEEIVIPSVLVEVYERNCLGGELMARARTLHEANYPDGSELIPYVVQRGDTLGKIASRHRCVTIRELAAINNIRPPRYVIRVGQRLKIPHCG